jgi:phage RecT family recombinase
MSTAIKKSPSQNFANTVQKMAMQFMTDSFGTEAASEAAGRLALALRTAAAANPDIHACPIEDIAVAVATCARTGLMPGGVQPEVYMIPRKSYGKLRLQWQISARGLRRLVEREGYTLRARPVFEGEHFEVSYGFYEDLRHTPDFDLDRDYKHLRGFYVVAAEKGSREPVAFTYITKAQIEERRKVAQTQDVWSTWPLEMAEKTAMAYAVRRGIVPFNETLTVVSVEDRAHTIDAPTPAPQALPMPDYEPAPVPMATRSAELAAALADDEPEEVYLTPDPAEQGPQTEQGQEPEEEAKTDPAHEAMVIEVIELEQRLRKERGDVFAVRDARGIGRKSAPSRLGIAKLTAYRNDLTDALDTAMGA